VGQLRKWHRRPARRSRARCACLNQTQPRRRPTA